MQTVISSKEFIKKAKNKYSAESIENIIEKISLNPKIGKKFNLVNNIYKLDIGFSEKKKYEYSLVYRYQGKNKPIFIVNIFKKKEKDLITKIINCLITEILE